MPDHEKELCGTSSKVLHFEADPAAFALLLGMVDDRTSGVTHAWSDYEGVIELGIKYQFIHLVPILIRYIQLNKPIGSPWRIFVAASTHDIPVLARLVLANFDESHLWYYKAANVKPKDMREVYGRYATAFIRALKGSASDPLPSRLICRHGRSGHGQDNNWLDISRTFNLEACAYCSFQNNTEANQNRER